MRNYAAEIGDILDSAVALAEAHSPDCALVKEKQLIRNHLGDYTPTLMFYGTYNAGKSTLLNALLDTNVAGTSDAPCTSAITSYKLGDYTVFDTPGIDAPQEHERLSKEHLQHCHAVVFVLSTGGQFDERGVVEEIVRIYRSNKPIVLVLNNKAGFTLGSGELESIQSKLMENCISVSNEREFAQRVPLLLVNAATAINGRLKGSERLLADSGVPDLERVLLQSLASINQVQLLQVPLDLVDAGLESLLGHLSGQGLGGDSEVVDAVIAKVRQVRTDTVRAATLDVRELRNGLIQAVVNAGHSGQKLEDCLRSYLELVQSRIDGRLQESGQQLEKELSTEESVSRVVVQHGRPEMRREAGSAADEPSTLSLSPEMQKQISAFVSSDSSTELVKQGLLKLRQLKVPGIKGRWEKTLGTWAGKITKGVGAFLQVGIVLYSLYQAYKAQKQHELEMSRREQALHESAKQMAITCEFEVLEQLPEVALEAFAPVEAELSSQKESLIGKNDAIAEAMNQARELQDKVKQLRAVLLAGAG